MTRPSNTLLHYADVLDRRRAFIRSQDNPNSWSIAEAVALDAAIACMRERAAEQDVRNG